VLHHRDWSETSLTLDVFTPAHGRLGLLAKGARRASSPWRGLLEPFRPLVIGWSGRGELPILIQAEADGKSLATHGPALYCGFYLNELLLRLLHRFDPHERLFALYRDALTALARGESPDTILRLFEKRLLDDLGYGPVLDRDVIAGEPIEAAAVYDYRLDRGPVRLTHPDINTRIEGVRIRGASLLALAAEQLEEAEARREAKRLMRALLDQQLGGRPLHTREFYRRVLPHTIPASQETGT
jgi:DNA repair protein RecO (recombination protein O)